MKGEEEYERGEDFFGYFPQVGVWCRALMVVRRFKSGKLIVFEGVFSCSFSSVPPSVDMGYVFEQ